MPLKCVFFYPQKVENELVDLIDELLERDAGTVNSTIIGKRLGLFMTVKQFFNTTVKQNEFKHMLSKLSN